MLLVALAGLTACSGSGSGSGQPLSATLLAGSGGRAVSVVLTADPAVSVTSVQLRGAGFIQVSPVPITGSAGPDGVRFALPYGEVLCAGRPAPTVVLVGTPSGVREVSVTDGTRLLALREAECAGTPNPSR